MDHESVLSLIDFINNLILVSIVFYYIRKITQVLRKSRELENLSQPQGDDDFNNFS